MKFANLNLIYMAKQKGFTTIQISICLKLNVVLFKDLERLLKWFVDDEKTFRDRGSGFV